MSSVVPITKIVPLFLWSAKMPKIYDLGGVYVTNIEGFAMVDKVT